MSSPTGDLRVHIDDRTLNEVGAGDVVGELAVLAPAPRAASVTAVEPSLLLRLRRAPFEELLDEHPEMSRAVISTLARLLQAAADESAPSTRAVTTAHPAPRSERATYRPARRAGVRARTDDGVDPDPVERHLP